LDKDSLFTDRPYVTTAVVVDSVLLYVMIPLIFATGVEEQVTAEV